MCTSFVLYADQTYIGMNFDISDRPIKLSLKGVTQFLVQQKDGDRFYPAFGINKRGAFMNLLMVTPTEAGMYQRGKGCVHIMKIFEEVLDGAVAPEALDRRLRDATLVNVPHLSVHSLVTGPRRAARVIAPGRPSIRLGEIAPDFLVLTNFPLSDVIGQDDAHIAGDGADRYRTCYRMLLEHQRDFSVDQGFEILRATMQTAGAFPTQFSMVALPEQEQVYFTLGRNFQQRFLFCFADNIIRTAGGFESHRAWTLDRKGILLTELQQWSEQRGGSPVATRKQ